MSESSGLTAAVRGDADTLMGVFGTPDTALSKKASFTGTAAAMTGLVAHKWYRFVATEDCYVHFADSGDATTSHMFMKAGVPEVFYMGTLTRVSAVQASAGGDLVATPVMTGVA